MYESLNACFIIVTDSFFKLNEVEAMKFCFYVNIKRIIIMGISLSWLA